MRGANYIGNCSGFDQLLYRRLDFMFTRTGLIAGKPAPTGHGVGLDACGDLAGAGLPVMRPFKEAQKPANAPHWCAHAKIRILRVHFLSGIHCSMPANAPFYPALAIFGHWHAICSLVRQVSLADYPRPATPFVQGSGQLRPRPSGGQHVEVGSTHQRS